METYSPKARVLDRLGVSGEGFGNDSDLVSALLLYLECGGKTDHA